MLLATRSWLPISFDPPVWVTTSPLPDAEWETAYTAVLLATSASPPVTYSLPSGSLPPGLALTGDTIAGVPHPAPAAPVWTTLPGSLGDTAQGASFAASLAATGAALFEVRAGLLPWGLALEVETGTLAGFLARMGGPVDDPGPPPVWITPAGSLGSVREVPNTTFFPVGIPLAATGAADYGIVGGRFPWGLTLDPASGAITGHVANIGGDIWEPDIAIAWSAPASADLGTYAIGDPVNIVQTTVPAGSFSIVGGVLPWGLTMVRGSGAISGTISAENAPGSYSFTVVCAVVIGESFGQRTYSITIS